MNGKDNKGNQEKTTNETGIVSIPQKTPYVATIGPGIAQFYGRRTLYYDLEEEDVNSSNVNDNVKRITDMLLHIWNKHQENLYEIDYLESYYRGFQPILGKHKDVRPTINNIVLENNAYFVTNFKVSYVFGEPIQFVQRGDLASDEIGILNSYATAQDKYAKDTELAESLYTSGIAHRIVLPSGQEESPFDIDNLDSKYTFCVYSSGRGHKKLIGVTYTIGVKDKSIKGSIYTRTGFYEFNSPSIGKAFSVTYGSPHYLGLIPIVEYSLNKWHLGIIEVVMSIFNALNRISSGDVDGLEQYIQSIMVFVNNEIDKETYQEILDLGAVEISTADPSRPADLKLIQNELSHDNTKSLHDRLFNLALVILGIPRAEDKASGGDTGQARLLSDGWTMADERAKQDEMAFKRCSKDEIKLILKICKAYSWTGIKDLMLRDLELKFTRNKSDNFLTKAQGMSNLITSGVSPDLAFASSGLFSDSNEAYQKSMEFYGGQDNWITSFITKTANGNASNVPEQADMNDSIERIDELNNE